MLHVILTCDDRFAEPACVTLLSVRETALSPVTCHVVGDRLAKASVERLRRLDAEGFAVSVSDGEWDAGDVPMPGRATRATYARLRMAELVPPELDRVIYLDCDLLLRADLTPLFETDLGGHAVGAVQDTLVGPLVSSPLAFERWAELGLRADQPYFNSGVMVIDLAAWRAQAVGERALEVLRTSPQDIKYWDQDALNLVLRGGFELLAPNWNTYPTWLADRDPVDANRLQEAMYDDIRADAHILHFISRNKPWLDDFPATRSREEYRSYLRRVAKL